MGDKRLFVLGFGLILLGISFFAFMSPGFFAVPIALVVLSVLVFAGWVVDIILYHLCGNAHLDSMPDGFVKSPANGARIFRAYKDDSVARKVRYVEKDHETILVCDNLSDAQQSYYDLRMLMTVFIISENKSYYVENINDVMAQAVELKDDPVKLMPNEYNAVRDYTAHS